MNLPGSEEQAFAGGNAGGGYWYAAPPAAPAPVAFGGRYEPRALLGCGGMAEVHLAHDTRLDRMVAVKTLRADLAHDEVSLARFRREAQSTASLNHPSIAAVYDTGEDVSYRPDGVPVPLPYLVMEYVDGVPLSEALYGQPPLTPERVLELAGGILRALVHSHTQGIVHRDIKPANVMVTRAGQVKVMDFGIARDMGEAGLTATSMVVGTAHYLSPEQALGQETDARSDLYSVGCLLYELLTYRPPFVGDSPMAVMYQHVQEEPQPPSVFNPLVTPDIDALVLRALAKDRAYRYQSAVDMLADVGGCLGARTVTFPAEPAPARGEGSEDASEEWADEAKAKGRRGTVALIAAGLAVALLAAGLGWFMFGRGSAGDGEVDVPVLVGKSLEDAQQAADNVGLTVTVTRKEPCDDQPKDHVCTQSPTDGRVAKGGSVSVTVSTGSPEIEVPDVLDKNEDDASRILTDKGFHVRTRHVESSRDAGTVLDQNPDGGEKAEKGSDVTLTVARAAAKATVPDLTGKTVDEATRLLAEHDLKLGDTTEVESGATVGTVVGQSEQAGSEVDSGSSVDVQVAKAQQTVAVPGDIVGKTLAEVRSELDGLGLDASVASGSSQNSDAIVTSSTPQVGSEVPIGSTVIVVTEETPTGDGSGDGSGGGDGGSTASPTPSAS